MKIAFCADDTNDCVEAVKNVIRSKHELIEVSGDVWPNMSHTVGEMVADSRADYGVVMCWTGTGSAIAANKVRGVRAAQASDAWIAKNARLWNDANILALSLKRLSPTDAVDCVNAFLSVESPDEDEKHAIDILRGFDSEK